MKPTEMEPMTMETTPFWKIALPCLLLALAPLAACGPGREAGDGDRAELETAEPGTAGAADREVDPELEVEIDPAATPEDLEREPLAPGAAPAAEEETPPERAPLGPELEAPPPPPPGLEEMPTAPDDLEEEIEAAEPAPPAPEPLAVAETEAAGKEVFLDQRCGTCHSVTTAGIEAKVASGPTAGGDLAGIGARRDRVSIAAVLAQEETVDGKKHPKRFAGSQEELDALIDWLLSQE